MKGTAKGTVSTWLLAFGAFVEPTAAQTVFKCVSATDQVSYQSQPCAPGAETARAWAFEPARSFAPERIDADRHVSEISRQLRSQPRDTGRRSSRRAVSPRSPRQTPCEAARAHRQSTLAKAGLKRNFDLLRSLDDQVSAACK